MFDLKSFKKIKRTQNKKTNIPCPREGRKRRGQKEEGDREGARP